MASRASRIGRACAVATVLLAIAEACGTILSNDEAPASDAGADGTDDNNTSPQEASGPDAGSVPDGNSSAPLCPLTFACPIAPPGATVVCDDFERAMPYVGWGVYGSAVAINDDGGCSGRALHVSMPPVLPDAGTTAFTKMLTSNKGGPLKTAIAELDLWLDFDAAGYVGNGVTSILAIGKDGLPDAGGRYTGINIDKAASVAVVVSNGSSLIKRSIPIQPKTWTHVRFGVTFGKGNTGRLSVSVNGTSLFDDPLATLPDDANDGVGFIVNLGIQSTPTAPKVELKVDNFALITN